ncbi:MAG TPA: TonB-dependent receptor, partial [Flavisolibacter sp.]
MKYCLVLIGCLGLMAKGYTQEVRGLVKNHEGETLRGVSIVVEDNFLGTTTKDNGTYELALPKPGIYTLIAQGVGHQAMTRTVTIHDKETLQIDFTLEYAINALKDITITAGRKAEIVDRTPASVQVINSKEIERQLLVSPNINNILASAVPSLGLGTNTTSNTGQTLRGRSPLILVDGIPQSTPLRAGGRDMRTIDPATIERIEVVKGATAIYGNGADGGIINYITKKPVKGSKFNAFTYLANTGMLAHSKNTLGFRVSQQFSGQLNSFDYILNGTYERTGVYKDAKGQVLTPVYGLGETGIHDFFAKAGYNINPEHRVEVMYNYFGSKQNSDYIEEMGIYGVRPTIGVPGQTLGVDEGTRFNHNAYIKYLGKNLFLETDIEANVYRQSFKTVYGYTTYFQNGGQSTIESEKKGLRLNLNTPYQFSPSFHGDIVYGVDVLNDITSQKLTDGRTWVPEMNMKNTAPYIQATANVLKNWVFKAGFRYDAVNVHVPDFTQIIDAAGNGGQDITGGNVKFNAPTFNTGLRYTKWEFFRPFISYTQGF